MTYLTASGANVTVLSGQGFSLSATFDDPGVVDNPWSYTADWGDGSPSQNGSTNDQSGPITGSHTFLAPADYVVRVTVTDKDGDSGSDDVIVTVLAVAANVDIKPGGEPNCIKDTNKGRIAVAVLWEAGFDPAWIDPGTVHLEGVSPLRWSMNKDVSNDGEPDLVFQFSTGDLSAVLGDGVTLYLTGELTDGRFFEGSDVINLAGGPDCFDQEP